jgi:4-aminobutyrate aminotransferase-like enzyme
VTVGRGVASGQGSYNVGVGHQQVLRTLEFVRADGDIVVDSDGREYIDLYTNQALPLGHNLVLLRAALADEHPLNVGLYGNRYRDRLAVVLSGIYPDYSSYQFYTSGSLANEAALRYATAITGRSNFAGFAGGFHGRTKALASLTGGEPESGGQIPGFLTLPYPQHDASEGRFVAGAATEVERIADLIDAHDGELAAIVVEPILSKFVIAPPDGWLRRLKCEVLEPRGILLIADETVIAGRIGAWCAAHEQSVLPDVLTFSKCFTSCYPFSGVTCLRKYSDAVSMVKGGDAFSAQSLQCEAVLRTLDTVREERLLERALEVQAEFERMMGGLVGSAGIRRVAAYGALCGVEFESRELARRVGETCFDNGALVATIKQTVRITPALNISSAALAEGLARLRASLPPSR